MNKMSFNTPMVRTAARYAQDQTGSCKYQRSGAVKYSWGELYSTAGAAGVERTGRNGIDGALNGGRVVSVGRRLSRAGTVGRPTPPGW